MILKKNKIQGQNMLDCYKMWLHMQRTSQDCEKKKKKNNAQLTAA